MILVVVLAVGIIASSICLVGNHLPIPRHVHSELAANKEIILDVHFGERILGIVDGLQKYHAAGPTKGELEPLP